MRRYHDMGGQPAGPIDTSDHAMEPWAKTLTAIVGALRAQGLSRVDELRLPEVAGRREPQHRRVRLNSVAPRAGGGPRR